MKLVINAWLERPRPLLELLDGETGRSLMTWKGKQLASMLEQGYLNLEDINDTSLSLSERLGMDSITCLPNIDWAARALGFLSLIEGDEHVQNHH